MERVLEPSASVGPVARFRALGRWWRMLIGLVAGAVLTLGHAPVDLPWGFFLAVPIMVWLVAAAETWRQAAWAGWSVAFGYFVTGLHWLGHAFLVDAEKFALLMPLGVAGLPAFLGLFWALAFALAWRFWPRGGVAQVPALAAWLMLAELARGHVLTGFPWALPAYAWTETPLLQAASWAGPYGLSLIVLLLAGWPLVAMAARRWAVAGATLAVFAALWAWGMARVPEAPQNLEGQPLIRIVQPNAPQHMKWDPQHAPVFYRRLLAHSAEPAESVSGRPDLILWPEMAVTFPVADYPEAAAQIAEAAAGAPVILGSFHPERSGPETEWLNALVTVIPDGTIGPRYDKHHLVPFGEYMPMKEVMSAIGLQQLAQHGGLSAGTGPAALSVAGLPRFAATVCYEMIFPHQIIGPGPRPDWILTITNDAWFGGFAGPQQHLAQAKFRAVEQGLPVARAANTGISTILDSYGRMQAQLSLHRDGYLDQRLPPAGPKTIYSFSGNFPALLACGLLIFVTIRNNSRRNAFDNCDAR